MDESDDQEINLERLMEEMRDHFFNCIERNKIEPFPISKERRRAKDTSKVVYKYKFTVTAVVQNMHMLVKRCVESGFTSNVLMWTNLLFRRNGTAKIV